MDSRHAVQERVRALKEADLRASSGMLCVSMADSPTTAGAASSFVCVRPFDIISNTPAPDDFSSHTSAVHSHAASSARFGDPALPGYLERM